MADASDFKQRVLEEKAQLDERIEKLRKFIVSVHLRFPMAEFERLNRQFNAMEAYHKVLVERIAADFK